MTTWRRGSSLVCCVGNAANITYKNEESMTIKDENMKACNILNADRNKDIWDTVKKILMEYIDDPFTCDPRTASREEFARRNINAVVFCEYHNWKDLCYTVELMGVVQGDTLITPNGGRIENFGWQQGELKPGMLTYEAFPHPNIQLANIGEMTTNHENSERLRGSLGFFGPIYDTDNDNG